ncbi:hypothetical protein CSUI_007579, partial [Cystoisospora suis]
MTANATSGTSAIAVVPQSASCPAKLAASGWVNACLESLGGKGGGKGERAVGASKVGAEERVAAALACAKQFA